MPIMGYSTPALIFRPALLSGFLPLRPPDIEIKMTGGTLRQKFNLIDT